MSKMSGQDKARFSIAVSHVEDAIVDCELFVESFFHNLKPLTSASRKPIDDDYGDALEDERNP